MYHCVGLNKVFHLRSQKANEFYIVIDTIPNAVWETSSAGSGDFINYATPMV